MMDSGPQEFLVEKAIRLIYLIGRLSQSLPILEGTTIHELTTAATQLIERAIRIAESTIPEKIK